jgi:DNA repair protein RecO (recombination protein O)
VAFDLLCGFLALLEAREPRAETLRVFELRLLDAAGLRPELEACRVCGTTALDETGQVFDVRKGGVVCASCHGHGVPLDGEARRAMCRAQSMGLLQSAELQMSIDVNAACRDAISALVTDHLGRTLRSVEFIAKLNLHRGNPDKVPPSSASS